MLPYNPGGYAAYQDTFVSQFLKFYLYPYALSKDTWDTIIQFWYLDLSLTDTMMQECYSVLGPQPRLPSCMLRSYLLSLKMKVTSITLWCSMLKENQGTPDVTANNTIPSQTVTGAGNPIEKL